MHGQWAWWASACLFGLLSAWSRVEIRRFMRDGAAAAATVVAKRAGRRLSVTCAYVTEAGRHVVSDQHVGPLLYRSVEPGNALRITYQRIAPAKWILTSDLPLASWTWLPLALLAAGCAAGGVVGGGTGAGGPP